MMYCVVGLRTCLFMLILLGLQVDNDALYPGIANKPVHAYFFPCICPDFLSFHTLNIIKFFVTDFCETVQAGVVISCIQNDNDVFYCGIAKQPFHAYSSQHLSNFLSFHILNKEVFRQRFL